MKYSYRDISANNLEIDVYKYDLNSVRFEEDMTRTAKKFLNVMKEIHELGICYIGYSATKSTMFLDKDLNKKVLKRNKVDKQYRQGLLDSNIFIQSENRNETLRKLNPLIFPLLKRLTERKTVSELTIPVQVGDFNYVLGKIRNEGDEKNSYVNKQIEKNKKLGIKPVFTQYYSKNAIFTYLALDTGKICNAISIDYVTEEQGKLMTVFFHVTDDGLIEKFRMSA